MTPTTLDTKTLIQELRDAHSLSTKGTWGKGSTTHETVSTTEGQKPYHIASFHHANDAQFCDLMHTYLPRILDELEAKLAAVQQGVLPVGEALCDDHGALPLVGTSAVLYNALPFGTKLYTHPSQQGLDAQQLHNNIMNLSANRTVSCEPHTWAQTAYEEGYLDARHAAAELVLAAKAKQGVQPSPETDSIAPTLMTNDQAIAWAWARVRKDVGTENWTTGDSCNFYGFFLHGWNYRGKYELQHNATKAAVMREVATHPTQQGLEVPTQAARDVIEERARQIELGYDHSHDDAHADESIAAAAAVFIMPEECRDWDASSTTYGDTLAEALLPCDWGAPEFGHDRRAQLVKGAAMAIAEIERLDRAAAQAKQGGV